MTHWWHPHNGQWIDQHKKVVARRSTESALIGVHDCLPQMLWSVRVLEAQGSRVKAAIRYQDNMSSMRLEKNGIGSRSRRTRHILLRYYFVKEHVDNGTIEIVHGPTDKLWADYFTKPLQGSQFYRLRDLIMNIEPNSAYHSSNRSVLRANESLLMYNDRRSTDRLNTSSHDDGEKSAARKVTRNMDSFTVSRCDKLLYSTVENDPEHNNGRSADGCGWRRKGEARIECSLGSAE
jgi:hypothetical protein